MITIFIHGTLFSILKIPVLHQLFYAPQGLKSIKAVSKKYRIRNIINMLSKRDPQRFPFDDFYTFGWSGRLSTQARKKASYQLYSALKKLQKNHRTKFYVTPRIRIITHSHGGNVALHLAEQANSHNDINFIIDELILTACPVQKSTENLIQSSIFKKIYSFHSHADIVQVLDPQGITRLWHTWQKQGIYLNSLNKLFPLFSYRHFSPHPKLIQVNITLNNNYILHIDFILSDFFELLPQALDKLENLKKHELSKNKLDINLNLEYKF